FFSSRRRHTRCYRDWSSDVCSSDLIHPFDDPLVMAGQGTVGLEILEDVPQVTDVIVSIGGGGLVSGVATAIKTLKPAVRIWGVEIGRASCRERGEWLGYDGGRGWRG